MRAATNIVGSLAQFDRAITFKQEGPTMTI